MVAQKLPPQQQRFVDEYLIDLNATQAACRAGYSERTARSQGNRLLTKVDIQTAIQEAVQARSERTEVDQDYVVDRLHEVIERTMQKTPVLNSEGKPIGRWTFQASAANRALELLGRHAGMFVDRSMSLNLTLTADIGTTEIRAAIKALPNDDLKALAVAVLGDRVAQAALSEALKTVTREELDDVVELGRQIKEGQKQKALAAGKPTIEARVV